MNDHGEPIPDATGAENRWYDIARERVQKPGAVLQWYGIISLVATVLQIVLVLTIPDVVFKPWYDEMVQANKDAAPGDKVRLQPYSDYVKQRTNYSLIGGLIQMAGSFIIFFGGAKMKNMESYGWGVTAAILAILPVTNCCCCAGGIIGVWSLVALLHSDVKLAFARTPTG
jgi:hypothetical protein